MNDFPEGQEYRLILKAIPAQATERVVSELTALLPLDKAPAGQIVQAAPIVLLDKLTAVQARNVESSLGCLRRLGVDIALTSEATTLKRLSWPVMPEIARHRGNVFVCPHCGERLIVQSAKAQQAAAQAVRPAEPAAAKPAPAPAAPRKEAAAPQPAGEPKAGFLDLAADLAELEGQQPQQAEARESVLPPAAPPARPAAPSPAPAKGPIGSWSRSTDGDDDDELEFLQEIEPAKPAAPAPKPAQPAAPVPPAAPASAAARPTAPQPPPAPAKPAQPAAPASAAKPARPAAPQEAGIRFQDEKPAPAAKNTETPAGTFRVSFMAKLKPAQRKPVAEIIAKYQEVSLTDALSAMNRPIVTVLRNATEEQTEQCRKDFKAFGITVQVIGR